jgi:hypothetical protein
MKAAVGLGDDTRGGLDIGDVEGVGDPTTTVDDDLVDNRLGDPRLGRGSLESPASLGTAQFTSDVVDHHCGALTRQR